MFELKKVCKYYNNNGVVSLGLRNIDLKLSLNEIVAITGDSGSGKSTLLNVITGVDTFEDGEISFYGNDISYFDQNDMDNFRKNNVAFIFQKYNIIDSYTVLQNVMLPLLINGSSKKEAKEKALQIIEKVGLSKRLKNKGSKLSGGEKQRCVIARALASDCKILACDEPTGNLDSKNGDEIIKLIKEVSKDRLVLIVTHNYDQVKDIVTRKIKMSDGEIVEDEYIEKPVEEEKKELDLNVNRINKKTVLNLSMQNIFSTPKKTTFTSLVFTIVSLITLILSMLSVSVSSITDKTSRSYKLLDKERLILYTDESKDINLNELPLKQYEEYYVNPFYEEIQLNYKGIERYAYYQVALTKRDLNPNLIKGAMPKAKDEYLLVIPKNQDVYRYSDFYDCNLFIAPAQNEYEYNVGRVTGIATSSKIACPYFVSEYGINEEMINAAYNDEISATYEYEGSTYNLMEFEEGNTLNNLTRIYCPSEYKDKIKFNFKFADLYDVTYDDMEYVYKDNINQPYIQYGKDYFNGKLKPTFLKTYEVSIYTNYVKNVSKDLKKMGYRVTIPTKLDDGSVNQVNYLIMSFFMVQIFFTLIGLYFISYAILSKIYASKIKDYAILRTLGIIKKDLGRMVKIETISLAMLSSILSLLIVIIFSLIKGFMNLLSPSIILIYFIIMFVFSYLIGRRFNRKVFKFSVNKTIKDGGRNA